MFFLHDVAPCFQCDVLTMIEAVHSQQVRACLQSSCGASRTHEEACHSAAVESDGGSARWTIEVLAPYLLQLPHAENEQTKPYSKLSAGQRYTILWP